MPQEYEMRATMWTGGFMREAVAAIEAEVRAIEIKRKRATLLAGDWTKLDRIEQLTDEQVEAEHAALDREPYDDGWKSEDYDTIAEYDNEMAGLNQAVHILRTTFGDERENDPATQSDVAIYGAGSE